MPKKVFGGKKILAPWTDETGVVQYAAANVLNSPSNSKQDDNIVSLLLSSHLPQCVCIDCNTLRNFLPRKAATKSPKAKRSPSKEQVFSTSSGRVSHINFYITLCLSSPHRLVQTEWLNLKIP